MGETHAGGVRSDEVLTVARGRVRRFRRASCVQRRPGTLKMDRSLARHDCAVLLLGLTLAVGCTDDFTVGRGVADAGAGPGGEAGGEDGSVADGTTCDARKTELARQHDVVAACTAQDGFCRDLVKDECDCDIGVKSATHAAVALRAYAALIAEFKQADCAARHCKVCRPAPDVGFACNASVKGTPEGLCVDPTLGF